MTVEKVNEGNFLPVTAAEAEVIKHEVMDEAIEQWRGCSYGAVLGNDDEYSDRWGSVGLRLVDHKLGEGQLEGAFLLADNFVYDDSQPTIRDTALASVGLAYAEKANVDEVFKVFSRLRYPGYRQVIWQAVAIELAWRGEWDEKDVKYLAMMAVLDKEMCEEGEAWGWKKEARKPNLDLERGKEAGVLNELLSDRPIIYKDLEIIVKNAEEGADSPLGKVERLVSIAEVLAGKERASDAELWDFGMGLTSELGLGDAFVESFSGFGVQSPIDEREKLIDYLSFTRSIIETVDTGLFDELSLGDSKLRSDLVFDQLDGDVDKRGSLERVSGQLDFLQICGIMAGCLHERGGEGELKDWLKEVFGCYEKSWDEESSQMLADIFMASLPGFKLRKDQWLATGARIGQFVEQVLQVTDYDRAYIDKVDEFHERLYKARLKNWRRLVGAVKRASTQDSGEVLIEYFKLGEKILLLCNRNINWGKVDVAESLIKLNNIDESQAELYADCLLKGDV